MKKYCFLFLLIASTTNLFANTRTDSTMLRNRIGKYLKYIMLPETMPVDSAIITKIVLQQALLFAPEKVSLNIEIYNVLYKDKLAVFSIMPSYTGAQPTWAKIGLDTIKGKTVELKELKKLIGNELKKHPANPKAANNLKHWNYALLIKKPDGWYCSSSDCFTEFFEIINNPGRTKNNAWQINLTAPQLSVAEYESAYRRKHGYYSTNTKSLMGYNEDVTGGDLLYQSYTENSKGEKKYHFWLLGEWAHDGLNTQRGTDRFVFVPGKGITSASYDFFMPDMVSHWLSVYQKKYTNSGNNQTVIPAVNPGMYYPSLDAYFTEYTIQAAQAKGY